MTFAFQVWLASAVVLAMIPLMLAGATGGSRAVARQALNPEDDADEVVEVDKDRTGRIGRAHRNSLENIPIFLILSYAWVAMVPSNGWVLAIFGAFVLSRLLHVTFYLFAISKPRTGAFAFGWLTTVVMMGHMLYSTFM